MGHYCILKYNLGVWEICELFKQEVRAYIRKHLLVSYYVVKLRFPLTQFLIETKHLAHPSLS